MIYVGRFSVWNFSFFLITDTLLYGMGAVCIYVGGGGGLNDRFETTFFYFYFYIWRGAKKISISRNFGNNKLTNVFLSTKVDYPKFWIGMKIYETDKN